MQMKKILGILLAVCFLMSVTAAAVGATEEQKKFNPQKDGKSMKDGKFKKPVTWVEKKVVMKKVIRKHNGIMIITKTKYTMKALIHGHVKTVKVWCKTTVIFKKFPHKEMRKPPVMIPTKK